MNEFEWRVQMRDLRRAQSPRRDLWASIDALMDEPAQSARIPHASMPVRTRKPHRWVVAAGLAASVLCVATLGWTALQTRFNPVPQSQADAHWKPSDPRLAGAAIELHAARMELQQALQQAPDSPALRRLLQQTAHQQDELQQLPHEAG